MKSKIDNGTIDFQRNCRIRIDVVKSSFHKRHKETNMFVRKRSDKLLLLLIFLAFALFGSAHLNLYWRYKKGTAVATNAIDLVKQSLPTPAYLSIKGFETVTLIPSDSFAIEWKNAHQESPAPVRRKEYLINKSSPWKTVTHYLRGDTLVISGYDTTDLKPGDAARTTSYIRIYYNDIRLIHVDSGYVTLNGDTLEHHIPLRLQLKNAYLTSGSPETGGRPAFDQVSITAAHSTVNLSNTVYIHQLKLELDGDCSTDIESVVDKIFLYCDDRAHIALPGSLVKKIWQIQK